LKDNHKWYRDIIISEERLNELPLEDNLEIQFLREIGIQGECGLPEGQGDGDGGERHGQQQDIPNMDENNRAPDDDELEMGKLFIKCL
jgi:hypothetical protein